MKEYLLQKSAGLGPTWETRFKARDDTDAKKEVLRLQVHGFLDIANGIVYLWDGERLVAKWVARSVCDLKEMK